MFAPQQYHPVLPFNLNFPMERAKASYEKSMIKEAIEEVLGPHLDNMNQFVGSKSGSGSGRRFSSGGGESSGDVSTVLGLVQEALSALNEARENQGDTSEEMAALKEKLEELEKLKETLAKERSVNEATLDLMLKAVKLVSRNGSKEERDQTFGALIQVNAEFRQVLAEIDTKFAEADTELEKKKKELNNLRIERDPNNAKQIEELEGKIATLEADKTRLQEAAFKLAKETKKAKEDANTDFKAQLEGMKTQLAVANGRLEGLGDTETVKSLKEDVATATRELDALKTKKEEVDRQLKTSTTSYDKLQKDYDTLNKTKTALDTVVTELNAEIFAMKKAQETDESGSDRVVVSSGDSDEFEDTRGSSRSGSGSAASKSKNSDSFSDDESDGAAGDSDSESDSESAVPHDTDSVGGSAEGGKSTGGEEEEQGGEKGGKSSISDEEKQTLMSLVNGSSIKATKLKKDVLDKLKTVGQGRGGKKIHSVESIVLAVEGKKEEDRAPTYVGNKTFDLSQTNVAAIYKTMDTEKLTPADKARLIGVIAAKHGIDVNGDSKMNSKKESVYHGSFDLGKLFMWL